MAKFDKVIPPGQEGKVELIIEGNKVKGKFNKSATITSNDPDNPVMMVSITGDILPYVDVQPPQRVYLQGRFGETVQKTLHIKTNEEDLDFQIRRVESNIDDKITYKLAQGEEEGTFDLHIWKNPRLPADNTYGSIFVHTNSEHSPKKSIQVQVITRGAYTVQPSVLNFGNVRFGQEGEDGKPVSKNVTIIRNQGKFEIKDITFSSGRYSAEVHPLVDGKRFRVQVSFTPPERKRPRQNHTAEMIIHTNDPMEPALTVKLVARSM